MNNNKILTPEAIDFENRCISLVGKTLIDVYFENSVEGFLNLRSMREDEFEYIPLSKLYFKMGDGSVFKFFDSLAFIKYDAYYTLDIAVGQQIPLDFVNNSYAKDHLWLPFIGKQIRGINVDWQRLSTRHREIRQPDIYPKALVIDLGDTHTLVVVASELDVLTKKNDLTEYKFICPDEALVVFFSISAYIKYLK